ncbi:MAG: hypothetical protein R2932_34095 [Caldilineaceae bacterium]
MLFYDNKHYSDLLPPDCQIGWWSADLREPIGCHREHPHTDKSSVIDGIDEETDILVSLFHPRQHEWEMQFYVEVGTEKLVGVTDVVRVTIAQLRLNNALQLQARKV